jgi:DNA repair ATPase RecN
MQQLIPMYNDADYGNGVTQRRKQRMRLHITGDSNRPRLFRAIRDAFFEDVSGLLRDVRTKVQDAMDTWSNDFRRDIELIRGENNPVSHEEDFLTIALDEVEDVQKQLDELSDEFALLPRQIHNRIMV